MTPEQRPTRIWYQSFVDPAGQAPYMDRLRDRLRDLAASGIDVDLYGMSPPDRYFHSLTEFRCADSTIQAALRAEEEGYDAFIIGHFQEPGLTECRGAVDIPVISLGEANLLFACSLGRRLGLVAIDAVFVPWHEEQIRHHGLEQRVAGITTIQADLSRFMRAFEQPAEYEAIRSDFRRQVLPLIAKGAEVLIPAGGIPMLLFAREQPFAIEGALVLDGIATVIKATEMALAMHRATGTVVSRRGAYRKASREAITDYLRSRHAAGAGLARVAPDPQA